MPTFGKTTTGTATVIYYAYSIAGTPYALSEAGTIESITVRMRIDAAPCKVKCAIYRLSDLALMGYTNENYYAATSAHAWRTFTVSTPFLLQPDTYLIVFWVDNQVGVRYDYIIYAGRLKGVTYDSFPDPLPTPSVDNAEICIYATYTLPPVVKKPTMKIDKGPHPRSRLLFAPTLILKGTGGSSSSSPPPPDPWEGWFMDEWT